MSTSTWKARSYELVVKLRVNKEVGKVADKLINTPYLLSLVPSDESLHIGSGGQELVVVVVVYNIRLWTKVIIDGFKEIKL